MSSRIGFLTSLAFHSAIAMAGAAYYMDAKPAPVDKSITMNLDMFDPPKKVETPKEPEPVKPKPVAPPPPVPTPEPVAEKAPEPEPAPVAAAEPDPAPEPVMETAAAPVEDHHAHMPKPSGEEKQAYLAMVASVIEKNKYFPLAARKRGLTGEARITMNINENGGLEDLKVECEHPALAKAAEEAVIKSVPFPKPNAAVCPVCLVFRMKFELK